MTQEMKDSDPWVRPGFGKRFQWIAAELLVIVPGVLIALAIDELRQSAEDTASANEYLRQLVTDLRSTEKAMAEVSDRNALSELASQSGSPHL